MKCNYYLGLDIQCQMTEVLRFPVYRARALVARLGRLLIPFTVIVQPMILILVHFCLHHVIRSERG